MNEILTIGIWTCGDNYGASIDDGETLFNHTGRRLPAAAPWEYEDDFDLEDALELLSPRCLEAVEARLAALRDAKDEAAAKAERKVDAIRATLAETSRRKFELGGYRFERGLGGLEVLVRKKGGRLTYALPVTDDQAYDLATGKIGIRYTKNRGGRRMHYRFVTL